MKLLVRGEEGELVVMEVGFLSYSGSEPIEYICGKKTEKSTGLYIMDTGHTSWIVPGLSQSDCDVVAETLFKSGSVSFVDLAARMNFATDRVYAVE